MGTVAAILLALVVVLGVAVLVSYNRFVSQRQYIENAWRNVDTELQRRHDLIPNLVATVKGYTAHEAQTLQAVVEARARARQPHEAVTDQARDENLLVSSLRQLLAVSEDYPDLRADASFLHLQRELVATEDRIQAARRFFNNNVRDYNRRVQSIPSTIVARLTGFAEHAYFEVEPVVRQAPEVQLDG